MIGLEETISGNLTQKEMEKGIREEAKSNDRPVIMTSSLTSPITNYGSILDIFINEPKKLDLLFLGDRKYLYKFLLIYEIKKYKKKKIFYFVKKFSQNFNFSFKYIYDMIYDLQKDKIIDIKNDYSANKKFKVAILNDTPETQKKINEIIEKNTEIMIDINNNIQRG